jgi:hypothetical protein
MKLYRGRYYHNTVPPEETKLKISEARKRRASL